MSRTAGSGEGSDKIVIKGLRVFGHHGASKQEQDQGQDFLVDVECHVDLSRPAHTDDLADAVDYGVLVDETERVVANKRFNLLEALAECIAGVVLKDDRVRSTVVRVAKAASPIQARLDYVQVEITRSR